MDGFTLYDDDGIEEREGNGREDKRWGLGYVCRKGSECALSRSARHGSVRSPVNATIHLGAVVCELIKAFPK